MFGSFASYLRQHHVGVLALLDRPPMRRCFVAFVSVVAVLSIVSTANADTVVTRTSVSGVSFNACTNELIDVNSEVVFVLGFHTDASGGVHFGPVHGTQHGTATGLTTGQTYVFGGTQTSAENFSDPSYERTLTSQTLMVSRGSSPNLVLHGTFHVTITPNGDVSTIFSHFRLECPGA